MGPYLSQPRRDKLSIKGQTSKTVFAASQMQGWRRTMEDFLIIEENLGPDLMLFGVFDGHGGKEVAKFVSLHFVTELLTSRSFLNMNYEQSLRDTFLRMDDQMKTNEGAKEVQRLARDLPNDQPVSSDSCQTFAGSSGLVALLVGPKLYVANAGDSRCVVLKKGQIVEMNLIHSPSHPKESERILNAGGFLEDGRIMGNLTTSRGFGDFEFKKSNHVMKKDQIVTSCPDVKALMLDRNDEIIVIGTKGVWDLATPIDMIRIIQQKIAIGKPVELVTEEILDESLAESIQIQETLGCDNMSLIIIVFKDTSSATSEENDSSH